MIKVYPSSDPTINTEELVLTEETAEIFTLLSKYIYTGSLSHKQTARLGELTNSEDFYYRKDGKRLAWSELTNLWDEGKVAEVLGRWFFDHLYQQADWKFKIREISNKEND